MNTALKPMYEWNLLHWRKLERRVFKLQKRIYRASQRGDVRAVRQLQKLLMKSWSAKCLAVRRVTQDNTGKKTAGVDGVKSLTPKQRLSLVNELKLGTKVSPTRRVGIPKPGTQEKRPLGIPTMFDRALQALVLLALEPEWEAKFEPNSYGFRPGRSCHDAVEAIFNAICLKAKYVLDADISKCFDKIDHEALLKKLKTFPTIRRQVRAWLKAGVMDNSQYFDTSVSEAGARTRATGTPQGGVISPLLANIALHGMENRIKEFAETLPGRKRQNRESLSFIRYADDFVILHENLTVVQRCTEVISEWLKGIGLELKPSKTRLVHTLNQHEECKPGFNFLGFHIRQFPTGKYTTGKNGQGKPLGFKTIITPTKEKCQAHHKQIAEVILAHRGASQKKLIEKLNSIIKGWANYYSTVSSKKAFSKLDDQLFDTLHNWAKRRHRNKGKKWIASKYWKTKGGDNWVFATKVGNIDLRLHKHSSTPIKNYVKVKGESSPYDGNLIYWSSRMGKHPEMPQRTASMLKQQKGKCAHCGLYFKDGDVLELDHIIPKSQGGRDIKQNWQLLHRHCHDTKTATDIAKVKAQEMEIIERFERVKAIAEAYANNANPNLRQSVDVFGTKSGCNSTEPKPPSNWTWFWEEDLLVMRCV